jgi:tubulin-specific chaperone A
MPAPSRLSIATSSVKRLIKEEASYHKELEQQEERIKKLEQSDGDENAEYQLKQEVYFSMRACYISLVLTITREKP